jgi:hypothetical protein
LVSLDWKKIGLGIRVIVLNATFNKISVILCLQTNVLVKSKWLYVHEYTNSLKGKTYVFTRPSKFILAHKTIKVYSGPQQSVLLVEETEGPGENHSD